VGYFCKRKKNYDIYYRKNCLRLIALYIFLGVDLIGANIEAIIRRKTHYLLIGSDENLLHFFAVFLRDYENANYDTFECFLRGILNVCLLESSTLWFEVFFHMGNYRFTPNTTQ
jgi:hypothetical protein